MSFRLKVKDQEDVVIVHFAGSIDTLSLDDLKIAFNDIMKRGKKKVLFVMKDLKFLNSSAIGLILSFNRWVGSVKGLLKIADVPQNIMEVFRLVRLDTLIAFYPSSADALRSFEDQ